MKVFIFILSFYNLLIASEDRLPPITNTLYLKECGSCHFAYQPQFLPQRSWSKMLSSLEEHFDSDASLGKNDIASLKAYLLNNSKKHMKYIRKDLTPMRISKTPYFLEEHRQIPQNYIEQEKVKSLSNCLACHTQANQGNYERVYIPNYGEWDD